MTLDDIAEKITARLATASFSGALKFDCGADGVLVLADGRASTVDRDADCTLTLSFENLGRLLTGKLNPMMAMANGKIKLQGNPGVALGLAKLIG
ncbi:MAG: sterol carrier protein [Rhodobacteraceae bacterium]|nr:sterol carrier protein [Paracoccaceae bacterium]